MPFASLPDTPVRASAGGGGAYEGFPDIVFREMVRTRGRIPSVGVCCAINLRITDKPLLKPECVNC